MPEEHSKKSNHNNAKDKTPRVANTSCVVGGQPVGIAHAKLLGRPPASQPQQILIRIFLNPSFSWRCSQDAGWRLRPAANLDARLVVADSLYDRQGRRSCCLTGSRDLHYKLRTVEGLPAGSPQSAAMALSSADVAPWNYHSAGIEYPDMIRVALTDAAYDAIASTLSKGGPGSAIETNAVRVGCAVLRARKGYAWLGCAIGCRLAATHPDSLSSRSACPAGRRADRKSEGRTNPKASPTVEPADFRT
jgi:hypothetical protein